MERAQILNVLRRHEGELRGRGVRHVALFGSAARANDRSASDIDLLVDIDSGTPMDVFEYAGIVDYLQALFPGPVDVANRETLKPHIRPSVERDAVYAF
jgi:hypothetical protein